MPISTRQQLPVSDNSAFGAEFARVRLGDAGQKADKSLQDAVAALQIRLEGRQSSRMIEDGQLLISLHKDHFLGGGEILRAVERTPGLAEKIIFQDRGRRRDYGDVVYDLSRDALPLARRLYRDNTQECYIVVTPPALGFERDNRSLISCARQSIPGKNGEVILQVGIQTEGDFWSEARKKGGRRQLIQSDDIRLEARGGDWSSLALTVHAKAAMSCELATAPRRHAPLQDFLHARPA